MSLEETWERAEHVVAESQREEWLTVKEFAVLSRMSESAIREAIREERLSFRVVRLTTGKRGGIRIVVPRHAA